MHLFPAETMSITNSENLEGSEEVLLDLESGRMSVEEGRATRILTPIPSGKERISFQ